MSMDHEPCSHDAVPEISSLQTCTKHANLLASPLRPLPRIVSGIGWVSTPSNTPVAPGYCPASVNWVRLSLDVRRDSEMIMIMIISDQWSESNPNQKNHNQKSETETSYLIKLYLETGPGRLDWWLEWIMECNVMAMGNGMNYKL